MARKEPLATRSRTHRPQRDFEGSPQAAGPRGHSSRPSAVRTHHHGRGRTRSSRDPGCLQVGESPDGEKVLDDYVFVFPTFVVVLLLFVLRIRGALPACLYVVVVVVVVVATVVIIDRLV
ncbi:hypothetical protein SAMD00023353_0901680 [Rosellinia necatrix]|uniref:Uncharacterized protein n=1 Tax=Rosellinia necatrix TaxID=77044 RepID=A0A1S8A672_ROSNE|nr:hypothetical protein SAMD00023353_0901680 [Rosellinia necatrix]